MSRALSKKEAQQQQLAAQQQQQHAQDVETHEHHSKASASAGLNLNLFGALSGALSSSSKKATHHNPDGSSHSIEERNDRAAASGLASGNANAYAQGAASQGSRHAKGREIAQEQRQGRLVEGKTKHEVDHLGIEG